MLTQEQKDSLKKSLDDLMDYLEEQTKKFMIDAGESYTEESSAKIREAMIEGGLNDMDQIIPQIEYIMATQQWEFDRIVEAMIAQFKIAFFTQMNS